MSRGLCFGCGKDVFDGAHRAGIKVHRCVAK
jgi:hypothetical protein